MACGISADSAAPGVNAPSGAIKAAAGGKAPSGGPQPTVISMECTQAYMPFSEADIAALSSNDTKAASSGKYSTVPTEAACKGPEGVADALCDIGSCNNHPVCNTCVELIITGPDSTTKGNTTVAQVTCTNNYFFGTKKDPIQNVCTDGNDKTWTCSGGCNSHTNCKMCVSMDDPALKSIQGSS